MDDEHREMLNTGDIGDVSELPMEALRARRDERVDVETGLSYLRRMVQGPLDLVAHERGRRGVGDQGESHDLVEELPELLADPRGGSGPGRMLTTLSPKVLDPGLAEEVEAVTGDGRLLHVAELEADDLEELAGRLSELERRVSEQRRAMHLQIDALQEEIAERYASGEASVDSLLTGSTEDSA